MMINNCSREKHRFLLQMKLMMSLRRYYDFSSYSLFYSQPLCVYHSDKSSLNIYSPYILSYSILLAHPCQALAPEN